MKNAHQKPFRTSTYRAQLAGFLIAMTLLHTGTAQSADSAQGGKLAQRWCSSCHTVAPGQAVANSEAPSFAAISASRKVPEISAFLSQSHPRMPDMNLSRNEIADLIAYMQSLAPPLDPQKPEPPKDNPPRQFRG